MAQKTNSKRRDILILLAVEVIALAAKSLNLLSEDYVLDLSDVSFIRCLLGGMNLSQGDQEQALALIAQKNAPGIQAMADRGILTAQDA